MKRSTELRAGVLGALGVALCVGACTSDHGALAAHPTAGGSGGDAGAGGRGGRGGSGPSAGTGGGGAVAGQDKVVEPAGRSVVTFLHGIVDAERVAWCFAAESDGSSEFVGTPAPPEGVAYGAAFALESLRGVDLDEVTVVPFAITGELALVADLACEAAVARAEQEMRASEIAPDGAGGASSRPGEAGAAGDARGASGEGGAPGGTAGGASGAGGEAGAEPLPSPPRLRVAELPALPPGSFTEGHSLLFVADGCLGGPAFTNVDERDVCGAAYTPRASTLSAELVVLSRETADGMLALQALHASTALGELNLVVAPPPDSVETVVLVADTLEEGVLRPRVPRLDLTPASYGAASSDHQVEARVDGRALFGETWPAISERSGTEPLPGRGYTLVALGPNHATGLGSWWNPLAFALVDNDPPASQ